MTITGCFIVKNDLEYCKSILKSWFWLDEIVIIDNMSSDGTYEFLVSSIEYPIIIKRSEATSFGKLRNLSLDLASSEYCIHLDMDMECTDEFRKELGEKLLENIDVLEFSIINHFLGTPLEFGPWSKWRKPWIHRRSLGSWLGQVHEELILEKGSSFGKLNNKLLHHGDIDFEERILKSLEYSKRDFDKGVTQGTRFMDLITRPLIQFPVDYLFRGNWRNGKIGLLLSIYTSTSLFYRLLLAWEKEKK